MQMDEENQGLVHQDVKKPKDPETRGILSTICYIIQLVILILLVFLVFKSLRFNSCNVNETENIDDIDNAVVLDKEDQDIMQFLTSPEDVTQFDNIMPEPEEEQFEELIFEAEPWNEGQLQGWQYKNGLTLIVQEKQVEIATLQFVIYHGYHDDEYNTLFMRLLLKQQCSQAQLIERAYMSTVTIHLKNEQMETCIRKFADSLVREYTQDDLDNINSESIQTSDIDLISKIDRVLDAISLNNEIMTEPIQIQDLQNYIELILVSNPLRLTIESALSNQEIYMLVSDTQLLQKEFGTSIIDSWDLEPILYNQIRINSNQTSTILIYPAKQDEFFKHLLLQKTQNSLQTILKCQFEILDFDFLAINIQDCDVDSITLANAIYNFGSFLKRQNEKTLLNCHKDFYNLQILYQKYVEDKEFSKKDLNAIIDNIQSGVIIIQQGQFIYQELKTLNKDDFLSSNFVNKKVQSIEYSNILLDYTIVSNIVEQLISQLKLPNLSQYIPLELPNYNFYTTNQIEPINITLQEPQLKSDSPNDIEPLYKPLIPYVPLDLDQSQKNFLIPILTPIQISQELWWQYDNHTNRVFLGILFYKPINGFSIAKSKAILKVAQMYIEQSNLDAISAGFNFQVESSFKGLSFMLSGWSLTFEAVKNQVLSNIKEIKDESKFSSIKEDLRNQFQEYYFQKTQFYLVQYWLPKLMLRPVNDPADIIREFQDLKFSEFSQFLTDMFSDIKYTAFVSGNIDIQNAKQLVQDYHPNDIETITKTLQIDKNLIHIIKLPAKQKQNAVVKYFSVGKRDFLTTAAFAIVLVLKVFGCVDGLLFYYQGTDSVIKLNEQIQQLIEQQRFDLNNLKDRLILHYQNNDEFLWDKIYNRNYAFNEINEVKNQIENVQISDFQGILQSETLSIFGVTESSKIPNIPSGQNDYSKQKDKSYFECAYQYQSQ
ncbi:unnamed protein product (macronuclear) [Paramecium tetraurelia]|uniref:Peptidase M16 middle/third domain-containing protein n=1 Tax=Paramecium tetraurelia TaxID=5888 RepID=A0CP60_PARTE|nr:uncharacterized protein GSPATT00008968001 [Paramecium tetraurelia]CAK72577.1 unnamed protein product [Paramecium tetraurelia]|eukprot:XP_001439974.1 hypothetical protein (macronuclear) [Paramecium tetraurelia strain d4-2]